MATGVIDTQCVRSRLRVRLVGLAQLLEREATFYGDVVGCEFGRRDFVIVEVCGDCAAFVVGEELFVFVAFAGDDDDVGVGVGCWCAGFDCGFDGAGAVDLDIDFVAQ